MIGLFQEDSECRAMQFFQQNHERITLLAAPSFIAKLYYAERPLRNKGAGFEFNVMPLNVGSFAAFSALDEKGTDHTFVVADPDGENERIEQMRAQFPSLRFIGLGRDVFPALVAKTHHVVFADLPQKLSAHTATLVIATPRSGSSLLADVLTDIGAGRVVEHLRKEVIEVLKSDYKFDFPAALRNFINFASVKGYFGTKLISHFLSDYLTQMNSLKDVTDVCAGLKLKVIFLDREDKAAQTISGYLASKRGLWHVTSESDAERLQQQPKPTLDFRRALTRYFLYQQQKGFLDSLRPLFPNALSLTYEEDLLGADLSLLARRLTAFVDLRSKVGGLEKSSQRQRIADDETQDMAQDFRRKFREVIGVQP